MGKMQQETSQVAGDLTGQAAAPIVSKINGIAVVGNPTTGQVLAYDGSNYVPTTITIPTPGMSALTPTATQTANYNAAANQLVIANPQAGAFTVTFPTAPTDKSIVGVQNIATNGNAVNIILGGSDTFQMTGTAATVLNIPGQLRQFQYSTSTQKWISIGLELPTYSDTSDVTLQLKTIGSGKAATINLDSASSNQGNIQGRVSGTLAWIIGRSGNSGLNFYTNGATQALNISDTQVATFNGDITMSAGKNLVIPSTTGVMIGTSTNSKFAFHGATPVAQPTGDLLTAIGTLGLVGSPTLSIAGNISAGANVTLSGSGTVASPYVISSTAAGGGGGTVTSASVVSANGFAGTVANQTTTPAITITTSVTGIVKGNGTALSAAVAGTDYLTPTGSGASLTGITESQITGLTADLASKLSNITGLITAGSNITITGSGTSGSPYSLSAPSGNAGTVTSVSVVSANGLGGSVATATSTPAITLSTSVNGLVKGNGTAFSAAVAGTDYSTPLNLIAVQTANYTANSSEIVPMNATAGALTVTLPTTPANNTTIAVTKQDTSGNLVTINPGGTDTIAAGTTAGIYIPGMTVTYRFDLATTNWIPTASYSPLFSTANDVTMVLKTTGSGKAATFNLDSASSTQGNIQGRVNGTLAWIIGRAGNSGFNIYTNGATQALNISDTLVATFNGDVTLTGGKNVILSATTGTKFATATTQKMSWWNATPVAQPTGNVLTALSTTGLVASPTLAESDITNLTTDLAAKAALASPALTGTPTAPTAANGTNTTQLATTAFVLANAGASPLTTKGDVWVYGTGNARLPIGTDGQILVADSTQTLGIKWASASGTGDMLAATYDPANVAQQIVGTTAAQTVSGKTLTSVAGITMADAANIAAGTTTGTQIGTATNQKIAVLGATPVIQQSATADLGTVLSIFGFRAPGTAFPITTSGAVQVGKFRRTAVNKTGTGTVQAAESVLFCDATAGAFTSTMYTPVGNSGAEITYFKTDASGNALTIATAAGSILGGITSLTTQYSSVTYISDSVNWYVKANH